MDAVNLAAYGRTVADVRAAMGEATYTVAWAEGRALPLEEAIALALAGHEEAPTGE